MITTYYNYSQISPAERPELATRDNVRLPYGGPTGTGGKFPAGTVLGCVAGTIQSEVVTLTISGTATHVSTFTADRVYTVSHAYNASLAAVKTAWEAVFGTGNVAVTGTPGTNYILTFQNQLANVRIGGLFSVTATGGTPSYARTTRGSSGAGQYDAYVDAGTNSCPTTARSILEFDYLSDPLGGLVLQGQPSGQPYSPPAFFTGIFKVSDLTGLDANAVSDPGFRIYQGTAITDTGASIALGV